MKYTDLYRNSGDSPELLYANDAMTTNIHVVIPVIDRNYDITEQISRNHENYTVIPVIHIIYDIKNGFISWFRWLTGITM